MSVVEYEIKFVEISRYCLHLINNGNRKGRMFERGLKAAICHKVTWLYSYDPRRSFQRAELIGRRDFRELPESMAHNDRANGQKFRMKDVVGSIQVNPKATE